MLSNRGITGSVFSIVLDPLRRIIRPKIRIYSGNKNVDSEHSPFSPPFSPATWKYAPEHLVLDRPYVKTVMS